RISFCSSHVAANGWYLDFGDNGNRWNGPITCMCESIAPSGIANVRGCGLGSCLTYGSVVMCKKVVDRESECQQSAVADRQYGTSLCIIHRRMQRDIPNRRSANAYR